MVSRPFAVWAALAVLAFAMPHARAVDFTLAGTQPPLLVEHIPSEDCRSCHGGSNASERTYMPFSSWSGSMMAHAGRDPLFWAALDVANNDMPGSGDYCLRCHAPSAWLEGYVHKNGTATPINGQDGCTLRGDYDDLETFGNDFGGVGCHMCHRQRPAGPSGQTARLESGNLWIDDSLDCDGYFGPCRFGRYYYPDTAAGPPPHGAKGSEYVKRSQFCGTCHDVTTPITETGPFKTLVLEGGTPTTIPFPVERTYSEWNASDYADRLFADGFSLDEPRTDEQRYGQTCQHCHMPIPTSNSARACLLESAGSRNNNVRSHEFAGANVWVLQLIRDLYAGPLGLDRVAEINQTITRATDMLQTRSATMTLTLDPFSGPGNTLTARARVTNIAGHKLPTGYSEGRRMWLEVVARDASNNVIWRSGNYNSATGELLPGNQAPRTYEILPGIWNGLTGQCETEGAGGRKLFHFVLNDCIAKDSRIPPLGFRGGSNHEIRPVGAAITYPETAPGSGVLVNYDNAVYAIPVPPGTPTPITVTAQVRYQIATKEYVEFLRDEAVLNAFPSENTMCSDNRPAYTVGPRSQTRGQFMYDLWANNGRSPPLTAASATRSTP